PWNTLKEFLYFQNYEDLSRLEYLNLSFYCLPTKILFLGGGSLPLTAILLAKNYNVQCKVVDYDTEAVELGRKLIEKLGLEKNIQYVLADAYDYNDTERYDVCYIAALIWGDEDTQKKLLSHIKDTIQVQYFLIRSSHGTRELLYRKVSLSLLRKYLDIEHIIHPKNHIINSIIIARNYE
ncbi:methyltransferase, partial [Candidatus Gracilibacteria bacterium]|nr:methyltransferase [Candidatus Gracilibacteria bacterium]